MIVWCELVDIRKRDMGEADHGALDLVNENSCPMVVIGRVETSSRVLGQDLSGKGRTYPFGGVRVQ
jgi:hypothetical protein